MKENYDREMLSLFGDLEKEQRKPRLLLHSCCAPCSSSVLEQLSRCFRVTVYYYNPNIAPPEEYRFRKEEQMAFLRRFPFEQPVEFMEAPYDPERFYEAVRGLELAPERGERCTVCYRLRLSQTAEAAAAGGFEYMATTLTLSPLKDPLRLNRIGREEAEKAGVLWLPSDFKKRNGYLRSLELSAEYGLYRQNYCGCAFSRRDAAAKENSNTGED